MASKGLVGLIKRGFHEIPDVMCSGILGFSSFIGIVTYYNMHKKDVYKDNMFRYNYTVMRPSDAKDKDTRPEMYN